ncbi:MAG: hypothetical protein KFB96_19580 [Thiocapsa sp.]|uniref:methyltransferase domain-containing protein n=1 Tax=Thiocapsa sp. TaxID=2024551 RepID=UPI001BD0699E|nr:methyltransferase domain-containing protein [Thiocapsa sp.]QVL47852.1 MAG: hypothetical protein KFB96_19580 [Thiocapsa sp.]
MITLDPLLDTWRRWTASPTDFARWSEPSNLLPHWDSRTRRMAQLIPPGSSVFELGAGRQVLREALPEGCTYTPSDLVSRGPDTLVCDLNARRLSDFPPHDIILASGVFEYVSKVPRLVRHLAPRCRVAMILSYAVTDTNPEDRAGHGWVNHYSAAALTRVFEANGFRATAVEPWQSQVIFTFRKA